MVVQEFIFGDAQSPGGFPGFGPAAHWQCSSAHALMPRVAIGEGETLDLMTHAGPESGCSPGTKICIIRMGPDYAHPERCFLCPKEKMREEEEEKAGCLPTERGHQICHRVALFLIRVIFLQVCDLRLSIFFRLSFYCHYFL